VWNDGEIIGAVLLSRTAESGLEWLFKRRQGIFYGGLLVLVLTVLTSVAFSWFITRPLSKMARLLRSGESSGRLSEVSAPLEIHALAVALDEKARKLESKNRYIAEFAANVSHELKTPLTSIRGAVELLQDSRDMPAQQRARFLANIEAATERTERLVTRLLYLARLESPQAERESDLAEITSYLQGLKARFGDDIEIHTFDERGDEAPAIAIGEASLEAVFGNLIENSLRYKRRKPILVEVTLLASRESSPRLYVQVTDDGPGISEQNQRRLFERFFTTERDRGGTGLGLSIVQATAERRGGRATIESGPEGTIARVWM
jgi:two-component system sensor histidine kinase ChvG